MPGFSIPSDLPFSLHALRNELDQLLDRVWHGGLMTPPLDGQDWAPLVDVVEGPEIYTVRVELPGLGPDDVDVSILGRQLTIKGCKVPPTKPPEGHRVVRAECRHGSFCRRVEFPTEVDDAAVAATCKNGVLELKIPKKPEARGRTVTVRAEPSAS